MNQQELKNVLDLHRKWVVGETGGVKANLSYANLSSADLRYANLSYANLSYADLRYANLSSADLSYANLSSANLSSADLSYADHDEIKKDFFGRLAIAKAEVIGLYDHLIRGKINGTAYQGECACFIGTIANIRKENYEKLSIPLLPKSDSLTERWFLAIYKGDTPEINPVARITAEWMREWMKKEELLIPEYRLISSLEMPELFGTVTKEGGKHDMTAKKTNTKKKTTKKAKKKSK